MKNSIDFKEIGDWVAYVPIAVILIIAPFVAAVFGAYCCFQFLKSIRPALVAEWMFYVIALFFVIVITTKMVLDVKYFLSDNNETKEE